MHDDAVSLVMVAENQQVVTKLVLELLNAIRYGVLFNGHRGVHEVHTAHGEGHGHASRMVLNRHPFSKGVWA